MSIEFVEIKREINDGHLIKFIFLVSGFLPQLPNTRMTLGAGCWRGCPVEDTSPSDATPVLDRPLFYRPSTTHSKLNIYFRPAKGRQSQRRVHGPKQTDCQQLKVSIGSIYWVGAPAIMAITTKLTLIYHAKTDLLLLKYRFG